MTEGLDNYRLARSWKILITFITYVLGVEDVLHYELGFMTKVSAQRVGRL